MLQLTIIIGLLREIASNMWVQNLQIGLFRSILKHISTIDVSEVRKRIISEIRLAFRDAVYMNSSQGLLEGLLFGPVYSDIKTALSACVIIDNHDSVDLLQHDRKNQRTRTTVALQSWLEERQ